MNLAKRLQFDNLHPPEQVKLQQVPLTISE